MIYRYLLFSLLILFCTQITTQAQIRTTYDKNFNIQGGYNFNTSPEFAPYWNDGFTVAVSREREFNDGWYVQGGFRFSQFSADEDEYIGANGLRGAAGLSVDAEDSQLFQLWGNIKYMYPVFSKRLKVYGLAGIHVSNFRLGEITNNLLPERNVDSDTEGYGGILGGGGLSFELIPGKLRIFAEGQYFLASTSGTDTIVISTTPFEFGISF